MNIILLAIMATIFELIYWRMMCLKDGNLYSYSIFNKGILGGIWVISIAYWIGTL